MDLSAFGMGLRGARGEEVIGELELAIAGGEAGDPKGRQAERAKSPHRRQGVRASGRALVCPLSVGRLVSGVDRLGFYYIF